MTRVRGYGQFKVRGVAYPAHRVAVAVSGRECPPDMLACHRCDNPACCNPAHLFLGTYRDNAIDMIAKGRHGRTPAKTKLTPDQVREIRTMRAAGGISQRKVAAMFGVTDMVVHRIETGKIWKQVA
jgi:hypothetical protein